MRMRFVNVPRMTPLCLFFGCWNQPGHFLVAPNRSLVHNTPGALAEYYGSDASPGGRRHLDGSLAPRIHARSGAIVCGRLDGRDVNYVSAEMPNGRFLRHVLDNGFTAIQWWDRHQGDKRGACNSTILLEGNHPSANVIAVGKVCFPHVFKNLEAAGIELVEVFLP